jgi:hypothetical protein
VVSAGPKLHLVLPLLLQHLLQQQQQQQQAAHPATQPIAGLVDGWPRS